MSKTNKRFFGGDPSRGLFKSVKPLPCQDFKEFFESQLFNPIRSQYTSAEFQAMSEEDRKKVKFVRYFTPSSFLEGDTSDEYPKNNSNVKAVNLLCLDIDPEKVKDKETGKWVETGVYPAAALVDDPQGLWKMLGGLNFAFYTTVSHTPEAPRARLVIEADNLAPELYKKAINYFGEKLGLSEVTTESKTLSQAMFRPTVFADTNLEINHPVIAHNFKGKAFDPSVLDGYEEQDQQRTTNTGGDLFEGLEFMSQPAHGVTLEDVASALKEISPDCSRDDWIKTAMALRHQFQDKDDEAFDLFDDWSSGSQDGKYDGKEANHKWWQRHIHPTSSGRLPTTIRTLFKMAKDAGWDSAPTNLKIFESLTDWLDQCDTLEALVDQGLGKIASSPLMGSAYETPLLNTIKKKAKSGFSVDYTPTELKKRLKLMQSEAKERQRQENNRESKTPAWARNLVYLMGPERIYKTTTGKQITKTSFDSSFGVNLLPSDRDLQERGDTSQQARFTPIIRPQDYVLNELEIPRVEDVTYDPSNPDEVVVKKGKCRFVNTYNKTYARPDREEAEKAGAVIKGHIRLLIKEEAYQRRMIDFIAFMVQNPGKKIRWAFLIQSAQGNGKGLLGKALRGVFGQGNIKTVDPEAIFSSFSDWAIGTQVTILNEIRVTGHSRHDVMNKLKEPISDDHVSINQKFKDNEEYENITNYLMFTNHKDAIAVEQRERRYFVVFSPIQTERDSERLVESGKLEPLQKLVDSGHLGGLRAFFEDWEISPDFCPDSPPPKTEYFYQMADHSKTDIEKLLEGVVEEGKEPLVQADIISSSQLLKMLENETNQKVSPKALGSILLNKGFKRHSRLSINGVKHQVWVDPDSAVADLNIAKILEQRITNSGEELL